MQRSLAIEEQRTAFIESGHPSAPGLIRPRIAASWARCRAQELPADRVDPPLLAEPDPRPDVSAAARQVFDEYVQANPGSGCCLVLVDAGGGVRVRRDDDLHPLTRLLNRVRLAPGYSWGEGVAGTTAAALALIDGVDSEVGADEHYIGDLRSFSEAAALVRDPQRDDVCGAVVVICHESTGSALQLTVARMLARQVAEQLTEPGHRHVRVVLDRVTRALGDAEGWAVASDGDYLLVDRSARTLDPADQGVLADAVMSAVASRDFGESRIDLPTADRVDVVTEPVWVLGELAGAVLVARPVRPTQPAGASEATRRQGSHVAPLTRRDFAEGLRARPDARDRRASERRTRVSRSLLSPFASARYDVATHLQHGRNHVLVGESGVGKRTLALTQFLLANPGGRVLRIDSSTLADERANALADARLDGPAHLLLLSGLGSLTPVDAHRLDELLRRISTLLHPPIIAACIDASAVDATRPYGQLLGHFQAVTRIPPLRARSDELGELAVSILHKVAGGRSLRLSHQVVRVLEGYAWPGNVTELEDALRYVVRRKPVGEIQPPDLPSVCFQGRSRRLSMLETAQCDAIIQALYESRGNRYKAAAMLGIARSSLYRKIDAFGISYIA
jgi:transcriptional regulator of acetoin/glycerol metabolism